MEVKTEVKTGVETEVAEAPVPQAAGPRATAQMTVTMFDDGNCEVTGPLHDRQAMIQLAVCALDVSYEAERARLRALAAAQVAPPKKWSREWWAAQFAAKAARRKAEGAPAVAAQDDEVGARLMAAKTAGMAAANEGIIAGGIIAAPDDGGRQGPNGSDKGPEGGTPVGETKH